MKGFRVVLAGVVLIPLFAGCAAENSEMKTLKEQVRLQQQQIVDLKAREQEHQAKLEILDNGFKLLGDKVDDNSRRIAALPPAKGAAAANPPAIVSSPLRTEPADKPAPPPPPPPPSKPQPPPEKIVLTQKLSAADLYRSALDNFTQENYRRSVLEFEEFVVNYPNHDLADNAQYWIGECYYAEKNFEQAVVEFDKVEKHFGKGNKVAASLLKKGLALKELGRDDEARATLAKVTAEHSGTEEASIAEKKLSQW